MGKAPTQYALINDDDNNNKTYQTKMEKENSKNTSLERWFLKKEKESEAKEEKIKQETTKV